MSSAVCAYFKFTIGYKATVIVPDYAAKSRSFELSSKQSFSQILL